jgi:hypothetical protein
VNIFSNVTVVECHTIADEMPPTEISTTVSEIGANGTPVT